LVALRNLAPGALKPGEGRLLRGCSDGTLISVPEPRLLDHRALEIGSVRLVGTVGAGHLVLLLARRRAARASSRQRGQFA
jgi:hypothetical protein